MRHPAFPWLTAAAVTVLVVLPSAQAPAPAFDPPRLADGHPDMQGLWVSDAVGAAHSIEDGRDPADDTLQGRVGEENPVILMEPSDGRIPYHPAAVERRRRMLMDVETPTRREHVDPHVRATLDGVPRINYVPGGFQIRQEPGYITILYESSHTFRIIPTDGRPHAPRHLKLWMGDSRARWEGDTLVVDVTNFTDFTWLDSHASFHSDALHVVERWTMVGADRIDYEATLEDAKVFTRPLKVAFSINRNKTSGYEYYEDTRIEGERDVEEIVLGGKRNKAAGRTGMHEHRRDPATRTKD
jgi:hypothetical protein